MAEASTIRCRAISLKRCELRAALDAFTGSANMSGSIHGCRPNRALHGLAHPSDMRVACEHCRS
eukprot:8822109-Pyramimonas_sp.AAC.1